MSAPDEPQRWFFVHMQKTAGTALFKRLFCQFDRDEIYPLVDDERTVDAVIDVDLLRRRFEEHRDRIRVVTGHFPLCATEVLGVPFSTFTVLRDPIERTLSFLRHNKKLDARSREQSLEEIYERPVLFHGLVHNHMVKMLSLTAEELTAGTMTMVDFDEGGRLETAKRNLDERIDVVGLQEHFDEFCADLADRFGFDLGEPLFANRTAAIDVPDSFRRRIAADNALDVELYAYAEELWHRRRAA